MSATPTPPPPSQNVRVYTRLRPLSANETSAGCSSVLNPLPNPTSTSLSNGNPTTLAVSGDASKQWEYDAIFPPSTPQSIVYSTVTNGMIDKLFNGYNVTILAYGQTGSGKTYTMGTNFDTGEGVIPNAVGEVFDKVASLKKASKASVEVSLSYLEIYNEEIRDLLAPPTAVAPAPLDCRENIQGEVTVPNLTYKTVTNAKSVGSLMSEASTRRATGSTMMNAGSSRSHAICTVYLTITPEGGEGEEEEEAVITSKFTLVDLAGSERQKRTGASGDRLKEGININKGLFVLGQVVSCLAEKASSPSPATMHVPYRDSKLTRLLTSSLGGNSLTVMVACVSPADINLEESTNTLRYASRARAIKNSATKNVISTTLSAAEAAKLRRENQMLKLQLLQAQMEQPSNFNSANFGNPSSTTPDMAGIDIGRLDVVMKLRLENNLLNERVSQQKTALLKASEEMVNASITGDEYKLKCEQLVKICEEHNIVTEGMENVAESDIVHERRVEIGALRKQLREAQEEAAMAKITARAVVMGDGDLSVAQEMALRNAPDDEDDDSEETAARAAEMTSELNQLSGDVIEKERALLLLSKEKENMDNLKTHFLSAMKSLEEEVTVLNFEKHHLQTQLSAERPATEAKPSLLQQEKMKLRVTELEGKIKGLKTKSSEHARSIKMREMAERKCVELQTEIESDKKKRTSLQRKMRDEADSHRNEKRAAEVKAMRMLREGDMLKAELNKVREAAAKQANVLKRKATEALAKQRVDAEKRKRTVSAANNNLGGNTANLEKGRKSDLVLWLEREVENMSQVRATKDQLDEQATLRAQAAKRRDALVGQKGSGVSRNVANLDMEVETRTGVICQLQRSLMELERENKANAVTEAAANSGERWTGLTKAEVKYMLNLLFDRLVSTSYDNTVLGRNKAAVDDEKIELAVYVERKKGREEVKKLQMEHSEAILALLESTKNVVQNKVSSVVSSGAASTDAESLRATVDAMLGDFMGGFNKVGDDLFDRFDGMREEEQKEKDRIERKKQQEKEKKMMKKIKWTPEEEAEEEDEFLDAGEIDEDEDSDYEEDTKSKKSKKKKAPALAAPKKDKKENSFDTTVIEEDVEQMLTYLSEKELKAMKVADLKAELKLRGRTVGGKKDDLIARLLEHQAEGLNVSANLSMISSNASFEEEEMEEKTSGGTPYAKKVKKQTIYLQDDVESSMEMVDSSMEMVDSMEVVKKEVKKEEVVVVKKVGAVVKKAEPYWKQVAPAPIAPAPMAAAPAKEQAAKLTQAAKLELWKKRTSNPTSSSAAPPPMPVKGLKRSASSGGGGGDSKRIRADKMANVLSALDNVQNVVADLAPSTKTINNNGGERKVMKRPDSAKNLGAAKAPKFNF